MSTKRENRLSTCAKTKTHHLWVTAHMINVFVFASTQKAQFLSLLPNPQVCTRITVCLSVCLSVCPSSVSENAYNSWTAWNILIKFSILIHVNIIYRLPCITVFFDGRGFAEHQLKIWDQLVKMLITLEPRGIFTSNFVYLCTLTLSSHCHAKRWRGFAEHHFGRSSSFSENAHNSWTPWYNHFKFCILMYFNIVQPLPCKTVTRLHRASFWPVELF